ncbi:hypothetical protein [Bifidobacterium olomucense]|nr:hypothetical protein [Bifidobacterium sp. DSM 109959]
MMGRKSRMKAQRRAERIEEILNNTGEGFLAYGYPEGPVQCKLSKLTGRRHIELLGGASPYAFGMESLEAVVQANLLLMSHPYYELGPVGVRSVRGHVLDWSEVREEYLMSILIAAANSQRELARIRGHQFSDDAEFLQAITQNYGMFIWLTVANAVRAAHGEGQVDSSDSPEIINGDEYDFDSSIEWCAATARRELARYGVEDYLDKLNLPEPTFEATYNEAYDRFWNTYGRHPQETPQYKEAILQRILAMKPGE